MKPTCKCSICETTFTRKNNGERHLLKIHFGKGQVVALNGQPLGNGRATPMNRLMMDKTRVWHLFLEERIRILARKVLAQDYKILKSDETIKLNRIDDETIVLHSLLENAIDYYTTPPPSCSTSDLVWNLLGLESDDVAKIRKQSREARKKAILDSIDLLELVKKSKLNGRIQGL